MKSLMSLKVFFTLFLFLYGAIVSAQVTVKVANMTTIAGENISDKGPIKIAEGGSVRLQFDVTLKRPANQVVKGTLQLFTKKSASDSRGRKVGGEEIISDSAWGTQYTTSKDITISASDFNKTGGVLYAEFKSSSNIRYTGSNWAVQVGENGTSTPVPTPNQIKIELVTADIRHGHERARQQGDFLPSYRSTQPLNSSNEFAVPTGGQVNFNLGFRLIWPEGKEAISSYARLYYRAGGKEVKIPDALTLLQTFHCRGCPPAGSNYFVLSGFISASQLGSSGTADIYAKYSHSEGSSGSRKITSNKLIAKLSNTPSITANTLSLSSTAPVISGNIGPKIFGSTPVHKFSGSSSSTLPGNFSYQWQEKKGNVANYRNIDGATGKDYSPGVLNEPTRFRRLAFSSGMMSSASATVNVIRSTASNSICCNQQVLSSEQPTVIVGSTPSNLGPITYQWERLTRGRRGFVWSAISGATARDYTPPLYENTSNTPRVYRFRRLVKPQSGIPFISNEANVTVEGDGSSGGRGRN